MNMAKRPVEKYDFKAFGEAIKEARKGCKESRKKVSDEMYISPRYLANIENNGQHPSLQIFFELIQLIVSKSTFVYSKVGMAFFSNLKISNCGQKGRIVVDQLSKVNSRTACAPLWMHLILLSLASKRKTGSLKTAKFSI